MPRKKKVEPTVTEISETIVEKEEKIIVNTKETYLFQITPLNNNVKLYKTPKISIKGEWTGSNLPQGKLKKGQVCNVICEINYTPIKMYKLDNGYYIIADQNVQKI